MSKPYTSRFATGLITWEESDVQILPWDMTKVNMLNMFIDLDGTIRRRKMPSPGIWQFDGQIFYQQIEYAIEDWQKQNGKDTIL